MRTALFEPKQLQLRECSAQQQRKAGGRKSDSLLQCLVERSMRGRVDLPTGATRPRSVTSSRRATSTRENGIDRPTGATWLVQHEPSCMVKSACRWSPPEPAGWHRHSCLRRAGSAPVCLGHAAAAALSEGGACPSFVPRIGATVARLESPGRVRSLASLGPIRLPEAGPLSCLTLRAARLVAVSLETDASPYLCMLAALACILCSSFEIEGCVTCVRFVPFSLCAAYCPACTFCCPACPCTACLPLRVRSAPRLATCVCWHAALA